MAISRKADYMLSAVAFVYHCCKILQLIPNFYTTDIGFDKVLLANSKFFIFLFNDLRLLQGTIWTDNIRVALLPNYLQAAAYDWFLHYQSQVEESQLK